MGIVFACIGPHGAEVIPDLAGCMLEAFAETRRGMEQLATSLANHAPETIVIATPHNLRLESTIGVVTSEFTEGRLEEEEKAVRLRRLCDRDLARGTLTNARRMHLPVVDVNYGTSEDQASCMPVDWGALIPLWFVHQKMSVMPKVVVVTPSRGIPIQSLIDFGQAIAESAEVSQKRVAFIASADHGHAHLADGPYGFNTASQNLTRRCKPLF